ncbi:MAG: ureidoglycolate lyase [Bacteroidetes bacterium]|nr:MAG: ureidoglycolate lyase [Bacteroidota bacterium]
MKLIRFGNSGEEKPGVELQNGKRVDISGFGEDFNEHFFETDGLNRLKKWLQENQAGCPEISAKDRLGCPIARPSKIICIGLNYSDHATESKMDLPTEPVVFFKSTTAICGPNDKIIIPKKSVKTDWEVELAVVIGRRASYIEERNSNDYIAGYLLHNDYSEREFQLERSGQWVKGKSCDTFAPLGPFMATADEVRDVNNLRLWLTVNGRLMQDGNTKNMVFKVPFLISYLSNFMTLLPGDIISTGTPKGVGMGQKPSPLYLNPGDIVELGIDNLGRARQELISHEDAMKRKFRPH